MAKPRSLRCNTGLRHFHRRSTTATPLSFLLLIIHSCYRRLHSVLFLVAFGISSGQLDAISLKEKLDWSIRYKVALGTVEGLFYLHEECQRRIIHRDIKAANILLTENFEPQMADPNLSNWHDQLNSASPDGGPTHL